MAGTTANNDIHPLLFLGAGVLLLLLVTAYSYLSLERVVAQTDARNAAHETMLQTEKLFSRLKDAETGQRGYLLTGRPDDLDPYREATRRIDADLHVLSENPWMRAHQGTRLATLQGLVTDMLAELGKSIRRASGGGRAAARERVLAGNGRRTMDRIRDVMAELRADLRDEIGARQRAVARTEENARRAALTVSVVALALVSGSLWLFRREHERVRAARAALAEANAGLEDEVAQRVRELEQARDRLSTYAQGLTTGIERERKRLAREVHDQLGQILTALRMFLKDAPGLDADHARTFDGLLMEAIAAARRIARDLRPSVLDDLGLAAAVKSHGERLKEQGAPAISVAMEHDDKLTPECAIQLYRIFQEALTNVIRHARARTVRVYGTIDEGHYVLRVDDDGVGLGEMAGEGLGLLNIRERAELVGGSASVSSRPEGGTRVEVRLPLAQEKPA